MNRRGEPAAAAATVVAMLFFAVFPARATVDHVGVGEVFVVAGQSNSANHGSERLSTSGCLTMPVWCAESW